MKKPLNFYLASISARTARRLLLLLGRNATHFPGAVALKICPMFLKYIEKPNVLIGVTGTNGKTTVTNLISDILFENGKDYVSNKYGSNLSEGIITTLLTSTKINGRNTKSYGILEIDERASLLIFPYIKPDYLIITNLFRDSYRRNASSEYIRNFLNKYLPQETKLIVNSEDIISSYVGEDNTKIVFSVFPLANEVERRESIVNDAYYCPVCDNALTYDFMRYHHIGKVHCDKCGFTNLKPDIYVSNVDFEKEQLFVVEDSQEYQYRLIGNNITDIYNAITAITALRELDFSHQELKIAFDKLKITKLRYEQAEYRGRQVIRLLSKEQNPVGISRTLDHIRRHLKEFQETAVIFMNEDYKLNTGNNKEIENVSWLYDADFEYLNHENVKQIIMTGVRTAEYQLRSEIAGIPKDRLFETDDQFKAINLLDLSNIKTVVLLYDTTSINKSKLMQDKIIELFKQGVSYEN